jgi:hypothetical protein
MSRRPRRNHTPAFKAKVARWPPSTFALLHLAATPLGSVTSADPPLIDAENLCRQSGPAHSAMLRDWDADAPPEQPLEA